MVKLGFHYNHAIDRGVMYLDNLIMSWDMYGWFFQDYSQYSIDAFHVSIRMSIKNTPLLSGSTGSNREKGINAYHEHNFSNAEDTI